MKTLIKKLMNEVDEMNEEELQVLEFVARNKITDIQERIVAIRNTYAKEPDHFWHYFFYGFCAVSFVIIMYLTFIK